jgi:regulator of sigma D
MGKVDYIENLENQIQDLTSSVSRIKNATDYIAAIEKSTLNIEKTNESITIAQDRLNMIQSVVETKLELINLTILTIDKSINENFDKAHSSIFTIKESISSLKNDLSMIKEIIENDFKVSKSNQENILNELTKLHADFDSRTSAHQSTTKKYFVWSIIAMTTTIFLLLLILSR